MSAVVSGGYNIGWDSCGIWHIGGYVHCLPVWGFSDVDFMLEFPADAVETDDKRTVLSFEGQAGSSNFPGQPWNIYRSKGENGPKTCKERLTELLEPTHDEEYFEKWWQWANQKHCPFLRLKEKRLDPNEWFVDFNGQHTLHHGAHFPLACYSKNPTKRSAEAHERRQEHIKKNTDGETKTIPQGDDAELGEKT